MRWQGRVLTEKLRSEGIGLLLSLCASCCLLIHDYKCSKIKATCMGSRKMKIDRMHYFYM